MYGTEPHRGCALFNSSTTPLYYYHCTCRLYTGYILDDHNLHHAVSTETETKLTPEQIYRPIYDYLLTVTVSNAERKQTHRKIPVPAAWDLNLHHWYRSKANSATVSHTNSQPHTSQLGTANIKLKLKLLPAIMHLASLVPRPFERRVWPNI